MSTERVLDPLSVANVYGNGSWTPLALHMSICTGSWTPLALQMSIYTGPWTPLALQMSTKMGLDPLSVANVYKKGLGPH